MISLLAMQGIERREREREREREEWKRNSIEKRGNHFFLEKGNFFFREGKEK